MSVNPVDRKTRSAAPKSADAVQKAAPAHEAVKAETTKAATKPSASKDAFTSAHPTESHKHSDVTAKGLSIKEQRRASRAESKNSGFVGPNVHKPIPTKGESMFVAGPNAKGANAPAKLSSPYKLTNNGGAVLDKPVINNIYAGSYWKSTAGKSDMAANDAFSKDIIKSQYMDTLKQYGVGKGEFAGSQVISSSKKTVTEADIQAMVKKAIATGKQSSDPQAIHNVVLPPGTILSLDGADSTQGLGGFHGSYADKNGKPVYYSAIVYSKGNNGIDFTGKPTENISITESHEWAEASTDPDVNSTIPGRGLAWYNNKYGEIGDIAIDVLPLNQVYGKVDGFAVQKEWSNKDKQFEV